MKQYKMCRQASRVRYSSSLLAIIPGSILDTHPSTPAAAAQLGLLRVADAAAIVLCFGYVYLLYYSQVNQVPRE